MKQGYNFKELVLHMKGNDLTSFIDVQAHRFTERFGLDYSDTVSVTLEFESSIEAQMFYNEIKFNNIYSKDYNVVTDPLNATQLIIDGAHTLFDYFGTREPNLLTISRDLNLRFDVKFVQEYSQTHFSAAVHHGELLSRQCIIEMSPLLPELSLGGLKQIARTSDEFDALLTRIYEHNVEELV